MEEGRIRRMDLDWRNPYSSSKLSQAVRARNVNMVKKLLRKGCNPDLPDNRGWTPLHEAAVDNSSLEVVRILLGSGAFVDHKTVEGETALFIACKHRAKSVVRCLLQAGADVNAQNNECLTPLHVACQGKNDDIVKILINAGADFNATDDEERTPVYLALESVNIKAIRTLLTAGADMKTKDFFSRTPLQYACMIGNMEIFQLLLSHMGNESAVIDQQTPEGWTLLMEATQYKNFPIVEWLVKNGTDTTLVDNRKLLALHIAAHCGHFDILQLILHNTPINVIEQYSTFFSGFMTHYRSLPCLIIDKNLFEGLELLFSYGLSVDVLKCPAKMGDRLVSPISFLLLHANALDDNDKLRYLEFLLRYDFLLEPEYVLTGYENYERVVSPIEAAVTMHRSDHKDCLCARFLSMLLARGASPDQLPTFPVELRSPTIVGPHKLYLFMKAVRFGFTAGLELLFRYSDFTEPGHILEALLTDIAQPSHLWTEEENEVVSFLLNKCTTELNTAFRLMSGALDRDDYHRYLRVLPIYRLTKRALGVASLKRLCRSTVRRHIHQSVDGPGFRRTLASLQLPSPIIRFLLYETDF